MSEWHQVPLGLESLKYFSNKRITNPALSIAIFTFIPFDQLIKSLALGIKSVF